MTCIFFLTGLEIITVSTWTWWRTRSFKACIFSLERRKQSHDLSPAAQTSAAGHLLSCFADRATASCPVWVLCADARWISYYILDSSILLLLNNICAVCHVKLDSCENCEIGTVWLVWLGKKSVLYMYKHTQNHLLNRTFLDFFWLLLFPPPPTEKPCKKCIYSFIFMSTELMSIYIIWCAVWLRTRWT